MSIMEALFLLAVAVAAVALDLLDQARKAYRERNPER